MNYLETTLGRPGKPDDFIKLHFKLEKNSLMDRWKVLLEKARRNQDGYYTTWGMYTDTSEMSRIADDLNNHIDEFNSLNKDVPPIMNYEYVQEDNRESLRRLNVIHSQFDESYFRLGCDQPEARQDPEKSHTRRLLGRINSLVHISESLINSIDYLEQGVLCAWFGGRIESVETESISFQDQDYELFTTGESFGDMFLYYARVGKSLYDIYLSNDLELLKSGYQARPIEEISAGFLATFGNYPKSHEQQMECFYKWWDENDIGRYGYEKHDSQNRIGFVRIATLASNSYIAPFYDPEACKFDEFAVVAFCSPFSELLEMSLVEEPVS